MAYPRTHHPSYAYDDGNSYELPSVQRSSRAGGYVVTGDTDDQDDVPIHARRQSRVGAGARYSSYDEGGYGYGGGYDLPPTAQARQSSYGAGGYTDSPALQERYNNPFEQPSPAQDFDVMADFNNAGPRYSHLYGKGTDDSMRELVKNGGRPMTSYRPQTAHSELAKPYRPHSKAMTSAAAAADGDQEPESAIERSYSTRHSTRDPSRKSLRGKPLLAGVDWDNSRHDVLRGEEDLDAGDEYARGGAGRWKRDPGGKARFDIKAKDANGVELVTVPALGPEWQKDETRMGTRRVRRELQSEKRKVAWKEFVRDQRGLCGIRWMTKKVLTFLFFGFIIALCIVLFLTIPRAPSFKFPSANILSVDNSTVSFSRSPTNFTFAGSVNMIADSTSSYLPVYFTNLEISVYDHTTNKEIATGNWRNHKLPRGDAEFVSLPVQFAYQAVNTSDTTWVNMYDACGHIWTGTTRQDIQIEVILRMHIRGLVTVPVSSRSITGIECPFELPSNSV